MTTERDEIEAYLSNLEGDFKGDTDDRLFVEDWLPKLLALVRCYQEAIQDELKRCGGTVPILKAALKKAKEIIK